MAVASRLLAEDGDSGAECTREGAHRWRRRVLPPSARLWRGGEGRSPVASVSSRVAPFFLFYRFLVQKFFPNLFYFDSGCKNFYKIFFPIFFILIFG